MAFIKPRLFCHRQELVGIDDAVTWPIPPNQSLGAGDPPGLCVQLRLVVQHEFAVQQPGSQVDLKLRRVPHCGLHLWLEEADGIPALRLRPIHCQVRILQQRIQCGPVARE